MLNCKGCGERWPCCAERNRGQYSGIEHAKHYPGDEKPCANPVNTLARALVFACSSEMLSALASDNHGNQWQNQKLSRDTVRMLSTFVHQFRVEWRKLRKDSPDWHEVGLVLAQCGVGYDDYGQGLLFDACKLAICEVWAGYSDNASWRLTKQGTLHLDCIPPQTPNPNRRPSVAKDIH